MEVVERRREKEEEVERFLVGEMEARFLHLDVRHR